MDFSGESNVDLAKLETIKIKNKDGNVIYAMLIIFTFKNMNSVYKYDNEI